MTTQIIDVSGKRLGKIAAEIAVLLKGKHKANYLPNVFSGEKVIVVNSDQLDIEPHKAETKKYFHYSGYPGGISEISLKKLFAKDSRKVIWNAVYGMLPKNKLRNVMLKNLEICKDDPISEKKRRDENG